MLMICLKKFKKLDYYKKRLDIEKDVLLKQKSELQEQIDHLQTEFRKEQKAAASQLRDLIKDKIHFEFN